MQTPYSATGVAGLHHVSLVSRNLAKSRDFYERVLGLRFLGEAAAPSASPGGSSLEEARSHWYGDNDGRAGSLISVVERPGASQGAPGMGGSHHFALGVADRDVLLQWKRRMLDNGYAVNGILDRHYFQSIYIKDPDGQIVELATRGPGWTRDEPANAIGTAHCPPPQEMINTNRDRARIAAENWHTPVEEITDAMVIQGLHHVTAIGSAIERSDDFAGGRLGMRRVKRTNNFDDAASFHWYWGVGSGPPGTLVTYFERNPGREPPVRMGAGQLAHYGMAIDPAMLGPLREVLSSGGAPVSAIMRIDAAAGAFDAFATTDPDGHAVVVASLHGETSYQSQRQGVENA